ncbi:MAG: phosphoethanolamine transferase [Piscinibacter sp.]|nr:phosphoethanolamine transferase [Piscinibacter sp.]
MTLISQQHERGPAQARRAVFAAPAVVAAILMLFIALGHDERRALQMAALALPLLVWVAWPIRTAALHRLRALFAWPLAMGFVIDGAVRDYLWDRYVAAPNNSMVLGAMSNTQTRESLEYLWLNAPDMLWRATLVLAAAALLALALRRAARWPAGAAAWRPSHRACRYALVLLVLVSAIAHASKPWRRLHPTLYWTKWVDDANRLREGWSQQSQANQRLLESARHAAPTVTFEGASTVMLVIGESINRDNLGLYGYPRDTTPRLESLKAALGDDFSVIRNAWSADASTLPSLRSLFRFGQAHGADAPHLLALARAAGYKVWWIGNQDDMAVEQQYAQLADRAATINRRPGRSGDTLDGELIDEVGIAARDPAPRKLIVVHLMGAHPHYRLRRPAGANPFAGVQDDVEQSLRRAGRSAWTREARREYDAALRYHDGVLSDLFGQLRDSLGVGGRGAWLYLADHGQEVGHELDRVGHSASTAAGYRIPALVWRSEGLPSQVAERPFRADWAAWTVAELMGLRWSGRDAARDVLNAAYHWHPPPLAVRVTSFER